METAELRLIARVGQMPGSFRRSLTLITNGLPWSRKPLNVLGSRSNAAIPYVTSRVVFTVLNGFKEELRAAHLPINKVSDHFGIGLRIEHITARLSNSRNSSWFR